MTLCVALLLSGLMVAIPASQAAAATPNCNSASQGPWRGADGRGYTATLPVYQGSLPFCLLGVGNRGKAVEVLQAALVRCNHGNLGSSGIDGIYGPITRDNVRNIQAINGINPDGIYGPQTLRILTWPATTGTCVRLNP